MNAFIAFVALIVVCALTAVGFALDLTVWTPSAGLDHMPWLGLLLGCGFSYFLAGRFGRANEPDIGPAWRWPLFGGVAIFVFVTNYHWVAFSGWHSPVWTALWVMSVLALPALAILAPSRWMPPTSYYWGLFCALGGDLLVWGFYHANRHLAAGETLTMTLWFVATVAMIVGVLVYLVSLSVKGARNNKLFFHLDDPAAVKLVKMGSRIADVVGDVSEVPLATERNVPIDVLIRGQQAILVWMSEGLRTRPDPRPFLAWHLWVGPSFFYPGIPGFADVASLREPVHYALGTEFATLMTLPDRDYTKGPFSTGQGGPEIEVTVGFNMRMIRPQSTFGVLRVSEMLDQLVDVFLAELTTVCGVDLYGFMGEPDEDRPGMPSLTLGRGPRPNRRLHFGEPAVGPAPAVALLQQAFIVGAFLQTGYLLTDVRIKDVDVNRVVAGINDEMVETWARRQLATAQAETVRLVAEQQVQALVGQARAAGVSTEDIGKILVQAATLYFMQGGDSGSALMAVLARRTS